MRPLALLVLAAAGACTSSGSSKHAFVSDVKAETELLSADRAFARDTLVRGTDGWLDGFADDGTMLTANEPVAKGKAAIRDIMEPVLSDPTTKLEWDPDHAWVSASADLGYTTGHTTISKTLPAAAGAPAKDVVVAKLKYLTVWKRQADGSWKVAATTGTSEP